MFEKIDVMQMAQAMARHAALRQNSVSQNIANADTPGYAARDVKPFAEVYEGGTSGAMKSTRARHLDAQGTFDAAPSERADPGVMSPNGNSVSLETEMVKAVEVKRQHDLALAIYKSSIGILRTSLGRA